MINDVFNATNLKKLIVTLGHKGSVACEYKKKKVYNTPVFSTKIVDRVGAGDAFLALTSPCVAKNIPMDIVGFIGNAAGALHVTVVGNKSSIEPDILYRFIQTLLK